MNASDVTLDKIVSKEIKSSEQLKLHTVDESLITRPVERALHLISLGEEVQKLSVIQGIPELLEEDRAGCLQKVVPKMQQALVNGSTELQTTASLALRNIVQGNVISLDLFVRHFLHTITQSMESRDPVVANSWSDTLIEVIKVLPVTVLQHEVAPLAIARAQMVKPVPLRVSSCKVIGELAVRYDPQTLKKDLMPTVQSLCQDVSGDVRAEIAKQLSRIAQHLGPELARSYITQPLIELSSDEVPRVKENAFVTIVETINFFPPDSLKNAIIPLLKQMIVLAFRQEDSLLVTVAKMFGKMCLGVEKHINEPEKELYLKWYTTMAGFGINSAKKDNRPFDRRFIEDSFQESELSPTHRNTLCREQCAYNFPTMARFCGDLPKKSPFEHVQASLKIMVSDPCFIVRKAIASCYHEICLIYWKQCNILKEDFCLLCRDDSVDVLDALTPSLYSIMEIFLHNNVFKQDPHDENLGLLLRNLLKCEGTLSKGHRWRSYVSFLKQTSHFYRFVPPDALYTTLIACDLKIVHQSRVVPVRTSALKNLILYMRHTSRFQHRKEIKDKLINEFCMSKNFYDRILYVKILPAILDTFSTFYFKEHFFLKTMRLFEDPVPNVRCTLVRSLPKLKAMIRLPADNKLNAVMDSALASLLEDKDKETKRVFLTTRDAIRDADINKLFLDDQKKYDEEKRLFFEKKDDTGAGRGAKPRQPAKKKTPGRSSQEWPNMSPRGRAQPNSSILGPSGRPLPPGTRNIRPPLPPRDEEMTGQEKEFFIDAGIRLPDGIQQIPSCLDFNSNNNNNSNNSDNNLNNNNSNNNGNNTPQKKWNSSPRIPVRRPNNQRHSLQFPDFNKNISTPAQNEKSVVETAPTRNNNHRSHLPRPLSCINFQTTSTNKGDASTTAATLSRQRHISKLPVINSSLVAGVIESQVNQNGISYFECS